MSQQSKHVYIIGNQDACLLYQTFGCTPLSTEAQDLETIIETLKDNIPDIGMILITSDTKIDGLYEKKLNQLQVPLLTIPTHPNESGKGFETLEKLVDKAVGMKIDFLK